MSPSEQAKAMGLKSLKSVCEISGVQMGTLLNWSKNKPRLFNVVLHGCLVMQLSEEAVALGKSTIAVVSVD